VIEWFDEYHPGAFRQAAVSFSTRIPSAFPLGDAMSMSTTVSLYSSGMNYLHFRDMVIKKTGPGKEEKVVDGDTGTPLPSIQEEDGEVAAEEEKVEVTDNKESLIAPPSPTILMVTKHANGTLNLWQLTFADKSKFAQVLSIGHASRASGHRFRVNDITCHLVLPSHHNIPSHHIPSQHL
jgi:DmX-like protein